MLFTIAIPTFNNAGTIHKAIQSALNQTFEDFEILIVNNNSSDNTKEVIDDFNNEKRIKVVNNSSTVSMWENHNICLKNASGDYVIFCHSDDELLSDCLANLAHKIKQQNYPQKYIGWGRSEFRDYYENWQVPGHDFDSSYSGKTVIEAFLHGGLTPSATCYSRKSFYECGGFILTAHRLGPSDIVTYIKLALAGFQFEMFDQRLFIREYASTASGIGYNRQEILKSYINAFECLRNELNESDITLFQKTLLSISIYKYLSLVALKRTKWISYSEYLKKLFSPVIQPKGLRSIFKQKHSYLLSFKELLTP